jgi:integrase
LIFLLNIHTHTQSRIIHDMALSELRVKQAKPAAKNYPLADEKGLRLLVRTTGSKTWQLRYRRPADGKADIYTIGNYPETPLKIARELRDKARALITQDIDPKQHQKSAKASQRLSAQNTFEAIAEEWFAIISPEWSKTHTERTINLMKNHLFPWLGQRPVTEITPPELLSVLKRAQNRSLLNTAKRAKQTAGQIFRYAIRTGTLSTDPSRDLAGALTTPKTKHFAALTEPRMVGNLLVAIDAYQGTPTVKAALQLSALLFQRPGEMRTMRWEHIDWDVSEWRYQVTKTSTQHIVPLSTQAIEILRELQPLTARSSYVFPSARGGDRPLSENGVRVALRTMGFTNDDMTAHGFRAMARTLLDEILNFPVEWIDHQLSHKVKDSLGRAYNRTKHLPQRKDMMQKWADYLDKLKDRPSFTDQAIAT